MTEYVQDYLDGNSERLFFDLDFHYHLMKNYPAMERKNREMAECFVYYLSEEGVERAETLSDSQHNILIRK